MNVICTVEVVVVFCSVIDEDKSESTEDHEVRMKNIRWHMSEGEIDHLIWSCLVASSVCILIPYLQVRFAVN